MKNVKWLVVFLCVFLYAGLAFSQASSTERHTVSQIEDHSVGSVEGEFVAAADAMPEDKYSFAPTNGEFKGVRTFAQQVKHVAAVNYMIGASILEEKPPVELGGENGPDSITSKADIMKFLKDSFTYAHKAMAAINENNVLESIKAPFSNQQTTRLNLAIRTLSHPYDHYGQMVEYLRMNNIIPPASRG